MQEKSRKCGILIFVKYPDSGNVKSRLSNQIEKKFVTTIYKSFVEDILKEIKDFNVLICYHPIEKINSFKSWLGKKYEYIPQEGKDLGERMKNCFDKGFEKGYKKLVVIGSDSPDLPSTIIEDAFNRLEDYDSVIGPCKDGGYYLLGFTNFSFSPNVFYKIPWSTNEVFEKTVKLLKQNSSKVYILPEWQDVDTFDDLKDLYLRNKEGAFKKSKTFKILKDYFHKINY